MTNRALAGTTVVVCALTLPPSAGAQQTRALSFDLNVGVESVHTSGEFREPQHGSAVDAMLVLRLGAAGRGGIITGMSAGTPWGWSSTSVCLRASTNGCVPTYPNFVKVGALVGWENASTTVRAMAGPGYISADGTGTFGVQARLDGAAPVARHLALVASARATVVPNYRGDAFRVYSLGLGIRLR